MNHNVQRKVYPIYEQTNGRHIREKGYEFIYACLTNQSLHLIYIKELDIVMTGLPSVAINECRLH